MDNEHIFYLLGSKFPELDSILIGCHADNRIIPHECCEYDLISIYDDTILFHEYWASKKKSNVLQNSNKFYEVLVLSSQEFIKNPDIKYTNFVQFPGHVLKSNTVNHFHEKCDRYHKSFNFMIKTNIINNICEITNMHSLLSSESVDERFISFQLKMISLKTLKIFINFYLNMEDRPSHLKYQINLVKQNENLKTREHVDLLLEYIGSNRANISSLTRSEKSLSFLIRNEDITNNKILFNKLDFFKRKSMYVDGILLINNFILERVYDNQFVQKYNKLLNHVTDIQTKEKITMLKEVNLLLEINKNLI
ncbi:hypothetical protein [Candidatus Nitrosocosmicus arcticus]|uniref:Uncharacterized protein n=1 Tax=Candidatus Nitrosocosmicus arcticus TaxID=2035267 RepID=A0A557SUD3_9ARCH|nr:hypothetical protein [Candidatus Nitrosocosmicus arcticus]TVP40209.1 hypothetical protein NARC_90115 [Candidatus Nitrosocosmicus arcticus]